MLLVDLSACRADLPSSGLPTEPSLWRKTRSAAQRAFCSFRSTVSDNWKKLPLKKYAKRIGGIVLIVAVAVILFKEPVPKKLGIHSYGGMRLAIPPDHLDALTMNLQGVAHTMQYGEADSLRISSQIGSSTTMDENGQMEISDEDYRSFKEEGPFTKEEIVNGVMPHEVAHRVLKHEEKKAELRKELRLHHLKHGTKTSFTDDEETAARAKGEQKAMKEQIDQYARQTELEADLYPVAFHQKFARGLRDALHRIWSRADNKDKVTDTHPSIQERLKAITKALCGKYPAENRDICS